MILPTDQHSVLLKLHNGFFSYWQIGQYSPRLKRWRILIFDGIGAHLLPSKNFKVLEWREINGWEDD